MSTIETLLVTDDVPTTGLTQINSNFANLNADKLESSDITGKQDTLVSGTNIKTINSNSIVGSGDLALPVLTDGDKGDITLTSSATVWTVDSGVITNSKLANVASATFKGRTTVGTGSPEDMTATQATALLNVATTSLKGLVPSSGGGTTNFLRADLNWAPPDGWALITSSSYTAGGTYSSGALTSYQLYKVVVTGTSTGSNTFLPLQFNNDSSGSSYTTYYVSGSTFTSVADNYLQLCNHNAGSGWPFYAEIIIARDSCYSYLLGNGLGPGNIYLRGAKAASLTSMQFPFITAISGTIKIYGKNF